MGPGGMFLETVVAFASLRAAKAMSKMGLFVIRIGYVDTGHWQYPKKWLVANKHFAGEGHMHHDHPVLVGTRCHHLLPCPI